MCGGGEGVVERFGQCENFSLLTNKADVSFQSKSSA